MKRNIESFIFGLVASIIYGIGGFLFLIVNTFILALISAFGASSTILSLLPWAFIIGSVLELIGSIVCIKNAKVGAVIMTIATTLCLTAIIYLFICGLTSENAVSSLIFLIVASIPMFMSIVAIVKGFKTKPAIVAKPISQNIDSVNNEISSHAEKI